MTREDAFAALQTAVEASLPELEDYAKKAKNKPARQRLYEHVERLRAALEMVKQGPARH